MMKTGKKSVMLLSVLIACCLSARGVEAFDIRTAPLVEKDATPSYARELGDPLFQLDDTPTDLEEKSAGKAALYSLLLPGLGQNYAGDKRGAHTFFIIEGIIWTSFIVFQVQGHLREDSYKEFAQVFAGVSSTDHSDDFYSILTEFNTWKEYEDDIKSDGRFELYPDVDTPTLEQYFVDNRISDYEEWVWQSADLRRSYQDTRAASKLSYRRAGYAVAAAIANRVASAFFAIKATRDYNARLQGQAQSFYLEFGPAEYKIGGGFQTGVSVVRDF
jgi:hypothetical protein